MALATEADVTDRLGRPLSEVEAARLPSLLSDVSALVIGWAGQDFEPAPYPEAVVGVVARMAARTLSAADAVPAAFVDQQSAGPFSVRYSSAATSGDSWLSAADKLALRPYKSGVASVQLFSERYDAAPPVV